MPVTGLVADVTTRSVSVSNVVAQDKVYDGSLSVTLVGQATPAGLINGDAVSFVSSTVGTLQDANVGVSKVVSTDYRLTGTSASNYTLVQPDYVKVSVTPKPQTITFDSLADRTYSDRPFLLSGTASSGLAVSFSKLSGPVSVENGTVSILGAGSVTVSAAQLGDLNNAAATSVSRSFTVLKAPATVVIGGSLNVAYDGMSHGVTVSTTPSWSRSALPARPH